MKRTTRLKELILDDELLLMPGVHDALAARIAAVEGFKAACIGGYGASASLLGKPDVDLLTMTEMADQVRRICDCVDMPILADADTGHGNTTNVARTVRSFEQAGAAGLFIEDQVAPKRCGHMAGKKVVTRPEMLARLKAALDARRDDDFVIMGRTDALAVQGPDEAIARGVLMLEEGADIVFVETPLSTAHMERINREIAGPTFAVYLEGGKIPLLPAAEFARLGFNVLAFGCSSVYAAAGAVQEAFREIKKSGATTSSVQGMVTFEEFNELLGLGEIRDRESAYLSGYPAPKNTDD